MDYKELLQDRVFSSPDEICEWMDNAQKAITELVSKTEELEKQLAEAKLNRPFELSGQGAENFALAIQLSEMQQKLKEVTAERDAAVEKLTLAVNQYRMETTGISLCGLCEYALPPEEVFLLALAAGRKRTEC